MAENIISLRGVGNRFGSHVVHTELDLDVRRGEILGLIGGSGAGKSVLLRSILWLRPPDDGEITVLGVPLRAATDAQWKAIRRRWGVLFQDGALYSSLTVSENIQVPLREFASLSPAMMRDIAAMKISLAGLRPGAADLYPSELSGGMRKRAGLARALALDPAILFLDEPTAGLDPLAAEAFDALLLSLRDALGFTVVMITHDLDSIHTVCDRVAVLAEKRIYAVGTIEELLQEDYPWIHEYFTGPRGRAAMKAGETGKKRPEDTLVRG
ncbi:ABC transporter ATP-binding protein [Desulfovibrio sp. OttesenSCG-928-I05]|nr:ABC transporter ATP-binding protein [Desulfovibrio sp. OttesenSCG-928-I05]